MSTVYAVCLVAVSIHLIAVPAFFWSLRRRQFRESDEEVFKAVQNDAVSPARAKRTPVETPLLPVTRARSVLLFGFLITFFVVLLASLVYLTVTSGYVSAAHGAD